MKVVVITGTPGVGKSTVVQRALQEIETGYRVINFGDAMLEVALERGVVKDRDEMRRLDPGVQKDIQRMGAKKIAEAARSENILVDTHATIKTPRGYLPGLPIWVLEELSPDVIVVVEADPEEIAGRRSSDETRTRDAEDVSEIMEHQLLNKAAAMSYAVFTGATVAVVENHDKGLEEAAKELAMVLR
ncbi:MAG: adenylate kinase [Methanobacteriota archaeon]|nr:MAG: adenylate kinase [Euryarchaeota archaeon]